MELSLVVLGILIRLSYIKVIKVLFLYSLLRRYFTHQKVLLVKPPEELTWASCNYLCGSYFGFTLPFLCRI